MSVIRQNTIEDMQFTGLAVQTQEAYVIAVIQLNRYFKKSLDSMDEKKLREYFLYLKYEKQAADSTLLIALRGNKFSNEQTLKMEWAALHLVLLDRKKKLVVVFSIEQVKRVLDCVHRFQYQVCLHTIYDCRLHLLKGILLRVKDIDSDRKMIHMVQEKGGNDHYLPLPIHPKILLNVILLAYARGDDQFPTDRGRILGLIYLQCPYLRLRSRP